MNEIVPFVIKSLHISLIMFMTVVPFTRFNWSFLILHVSTALLLLLHWFANEDKCAMTFFESYLRGIPETKSFMYGLVSPVYKIDDDVLKKVVTIATIILGGISVYRLYKNWYYVRSQVKLIYDVIIGK